MLNNLIKFLFDKEIILYSVHRQTLPIVNNYENKKDYIFINIKYIWRIFPLPGKYKIKFRIVYLLLNLINPKYIIDINWISRWDSLYKVWTKNHQKSKFIVIQHGSYVGGEITDVAHRYTKCDIFLTWGDYYTSIFKAYNSKKQTRIITFGNPVYNLLNRDITSYSNHKNHKILIIPSVIKKERLLAFDELFNKLNEIGFTLYFKEHNYQGRKVKSNNKKIEYPEINNINKVSGNLKDILVSNNYDLIISDHSTALLDAIYLKNKILFFAPDYEIAEYQHNNYSKNLKNLFYYFKDMNSKEDLYNFVSIESQEKLLSQMIYQGDNILKNYLKI